MMSEFPPELMPHLPPAAALDRLVYLVGPARGGTSILHYAMNVHPRTMVLPNVSHFNQRLWRYHRKVHDRMLRDILRLPKFWSERDARQRLGEHHPVYTRLVNRSLASGDLAQLYKLYPINYALNPAFTKDVSGIACWHDKQNDWRYLGAILQAFPRGRFIMVVRDPRSVALSASRRVAMKAGATAAYPRREDIITMALYWRFLVQRCLDVAGRHPDRSIVVRYEDFVTAPAATLNRVFALTTGETMDETAIEQKLMVAYGGSTNDWKGDYVGVSREPLERWKTELEPDDIALVEQLTGPTARKLGYDVPGGDRLIPILRSLNGISERSLRVRSMLKTLLSEAYETQIRAPL
jgi:hypothetical protein